MPTTVEETKESKPSEDKKDELLLDSLEIKGYRCFEHLTIEKLGRVNLIVGKNNVGKTALLEALWIYLNQGSSLLDIFNVLDDILNDRYENRLPVSFSGYNNIIYRIFFNRYSNEITTIQIGSLKSENLFVANWLSPNHGIGISQNTQKRIKNVFIKTDGLNNQEIIRFWDKIELTPSEDAVIKSMRFILPDLLRVRLKSVQNDERIPYAQVENLNEPFSLKSFGEGLNRLFGISLALVNCKDGVLLIDEVEGGFHYSVLPDVWKLIFKTAKDLNVQVFATTHSYDCIEAFAQAAIDDEESEGNLIRLARKGDQIKAFTFDEKQLETITKEHIEVR